MRSAARLKQKPSDFRASERAAAEQTRLELHELTSSAIARRDDWVVWLLDEWRPRRLRDQRTRQA